MPIILSQHLAAPIPEPVRKAIALSGVPFKPAGTACLLPENPERPDIVVLWRKGADASAELAAAVELAREMRCRVFVAVESRKGWNMFSSRLATRH